MTPEQTAICAPHRWTLVQKSPDRMLFAHPNGVKLSIRGEHDAWSIQKYKPRGHLGWTSPYWLAEIPRLHPTWGPQAVIDDTLRVVDPDLRARMDVLLTQIRFWAWSTCPPQPHLGPMVLLRPFGAVGHAKRTIDRTPLPQELRVRLQALRHVMLPEEDSARMSPCQANIPLHLPTTIHGVLSLKARMAALDPSP